MSEEEKTILIPPEADVSACLSENTTEIVGGRYRLISVLGRGGMGVVYRVEQIFLSKEMALKTLDKSRISQTALNRFQKEAKAAFLLDHPNLIKMHDFGFFTDGTPFLAMELVSGVTLAEDLKKNVMMPIERAIPIFIQLCFGLAYAHERGVVHRDVKPGNIMLIDRSDASKDVGVKIVDFGIAKLLQDEGGEAQSMTRTGEIFGSPFYMSPEQCVGGRVDHRSDIYSLGCVLFEVLTGTPPFVGENALSTMMQHQSGDALPLRQASLGKAFPESLENLVSKMLAKSPDDRYQNLGVVAHELDCIKRGDAVSRSMTTVALRPARKSFYRPSTLLGASVLIFAIGCVTGYMFKASVNQVQADRQTKKLAVKNLDSQLALSDNELESMYLPPSPKDLQRMLGPGKNDLVMLRSQLIDRGILEKIAANKRITKLDLQDSKFDDQNSIEALKLAALEELSLSGSNFGDAGAIAISTMPHLKSLKALKTDLTDYGVEALARSKTLERIAISAENFTGSSLQSISRMNSLNSLDLLGSERIGDKDVAYLKGQHLKFLGLGGTGVSDVFLDQISQLSALESIDLSYANVSEKGLLAVLKLDSLKSINVSHCPKIDKLTCSRLSKIRPDVNFRFD